MSALSLAFTGVPTSATGHEEEMCLLGQMCGGDGMFSKAEHFTSVQIARSLRLSAPRAACSSSFLSSSPLFRMAISSSLSTNI